MINDVASGEGDIWSHDTHIPTPSPPGSPSHEPTPILSRSITMDTDSSEESSDEEDDDDQVSCSVYAIWDGDISNQTQFNN